MTQNHSKLSDDDLLRLLSKEEDRLPRAAVDELLRRLPGLRPRLTQIIEDEGRWEAQDWAPTHATFVLAKEKAPSSLEALLRGLDHAVTHDHAMVLDAADSMLASYGPDAIPTLIAACDRASADLCLWINDALTHIAEAHPTARDAVCAHLKKSALADGDRTVAICAAHNWLPYAGPKERETLELLADRGVIEDADVEEALEGRAELPMEPTFDWMEFYDPGAAAERQAQREAMEDGGDEPDVSIPDDPALDVLSRATDRPESSMPIVNAEPKVGRNDPCPCGSGKKYKKCCAS